MNQKMAAAKSGTGTSPQKRQDAACVVDLAQSGHRCRLGYFGVKFGCIDDCKLNKVAPMGVPSEAKGQW